MITELGWWWLGFHGFVLAMLALDLGVFHRHSHEVKVREALTWTGIWIGLALLFNLGIYQGWVGVYEEAVRGRVALEFLTGYLLEKSLSVDNVFVFALLFSYFAVPPKYQHRVLFWGILGALVMRAILIFAGIALIKNFHWVLYIMGAILIVSGVKMFLHKGDAPDLEGNRVLKFIRSRLPVGPEFEGDKFFTRVGGKRAITPLMVVLIFIEWSDLVFAVDSIPAVLAVTEDPFLVYTSNVFAILGLRSLYFALAGILPLFRYLHYGLSAILIFIGAKMLLIDVYKIPILISLGLVVLILAGSVAASLWGPGKKEQIP